MQTLTHWSYNHIRPHALQVQKWASGTWCSWLTLSFGALPRADKISASFGWISHSLSRGVKPYIRSLSYVSLDSCSGVMVQSRVEERNLEKMQQGAHTCTAATPGPHLESHRKWVVLHPEEFLTCTKHLDPNGFACTEDWDHDILVSLWVLCLWIPRKKRALDLSWTARGYSDKVKTKLHRADKLKLNGSCGRS